MADDNRFKGLRDELDKDDQDDSPSNDDETAATTTVSDSTTEEAAFSFDATEQKSIYALPETFEKMDDAEFGVQITLRKDHDVRDVKRREFFDAALRVAAEHPEEIAKKILEGREEDE